jgi:hypothetical protein
MTLSTLTCDYAGKVYSLRQVMTFLGQECEQSAV